MPELIKEDGSDMWDLKNLTNLTRLNMGCSREKKDINHLTNLTYLNLEFNSHVNFTKLTNLTYLNLGYKVYKKSYTDNVLLMLTNLTELKYK
jgi:Leucine-rich repeat (LRR) protein